MPARYARGSARAELTPPRPGAARTPLLAADMPPRARRSPLPPPGPTAHLHRSRGRRRNSARRAPRRALKSGAGQRRGSAAGSRSPAGSQCAEGRLPLLARPVRSVLPAAAAAARPLPRWCERFRLATASLRAAEHAQSAARAGPALRAPRVRSSGCSRRPAGEGGPGGPGGRGRRGPTGPGPQAAPRGAAWLGPLLYFPGIRSSGEGPSCESGGSLPEAGTKPRFTVGRPAAGGGAGAARNRERELGLLEGGLGGTSLRP